MSPIQGQVHIYRRESGAQLELWVYRYPNIIEHITKKYTEKILNKVTKDELALCAAKS